MKPLVSQLWPQFMADPDFAACFGKVVVEHALMLRARQKVIFTLQSAAPLDKGLCARLLASLQPDYEGYQLSIENHSAFSTGARCPSRMNRSRWGPATAPAFCRI